MKINVLDSLKDYEGKEIKSLDTNKKEVSFTLRTAISMALNGNVVVNGQAQPITAEDKAKIYQLCTKLFSNKEVDFTVDDMAFIKERAGKVAEINPLVYGQLCKLFEKN